MGDVELKVPAEVANGQRIMKTDELTLRFLEAIDKRLVSIDASLGLIKFIMVIWAIGSLLVGCGQSLLQ